MAPKKAKQKEATLTKQLPLKKSPIQVSLDKEHQVNTPELVAGIETLERAAYQPSVSVNQTANMPPYPMKESKHVSNQSSFSLVDGVAALEMSLLDKIVNAHQNTTGICHHQNGWQGHGEIHGLFHHKSNQSLLPLLQVPTSEGITNNIMNRLLQGFIPNASWVPNSLAGISCLKVSTFNEDHSTNTENTAFLRLMYC